MTTYTEETGTEKKEVRKPKVPQATKLPLPPVMTEEAKRRFRDHNSTCQDILASLNDDLDYTEIDTSVPDTMRQEIAALRQHADKMEGLLP